MKRTKTISKNWFDDEILFKDPVTGDIHLKEGVTRLKYKPLIDPELEESYINPDELAVRNAELIEQKLGINDYDGKYNE